MAFDRISKESAQEVWFPKYTMQAMNMSDLLKKDINKKEVAQGCL